MRKLLKKAVLFGLCSALTVSGITFNVSSAEPLDGVSLKGIYEVYNTVSISDLKSKPLNENYSAVWMTADSKAGSYTEKGTENTYFVKSTDAGKWLKATVTTDDGCFETEPKQIETVNGVVPFDGTAASQIGNNEKTPTQYKFTVDGMEFILLDVTDDDKSKFLVMSNSHVGVRRYSAFVKFTNDTDYNVEANRANYSIASTVVDMAAFLNDKDSVNVIVADGEPESYNGAWKYGTTGEMSGSYAHGAVPSYGYSQQTRYWKLLPNDIKSHINHDKYWVCEPADIAFEGEIFAVQGGIMLPSHSEIEKYADRIGLWETYDVSTTAAKLSTCWWTRSPSESASTYTVEFSVLGKTGSRQGHTNGHSGCSVRPVFYLDRDFFLDVELDPALVGDEVKKAIRAAYSKADMYADGPYTKLQLEHDWGYGYDLSAEAEYTLSGEALIVDTTISCEMGSYTDFVILCTVFNADGQLIGADAQKMSITEGESLAAEDFIFSGISGVQTVNISLMNESGFWPLIKQTAAEQKN